MARKTVAGNGPNLISQIQTRDWVFPLVLWAEEGGRPLMMPSGYFNVLKAKQCQVFLVGLGRALPKTDCGYTSVEGSTAYEQLPRVCFEIGAIGATIGTRRHSLGLDGLRPRHTDRCMIGPFRRVMHDTCISRLCWDEYLLLTGVLRPCWP